MAVRDLLSEAVRETYNQILQEEEVDENEYEVEEVDDTASEESNEAEVDSDVDTEVDDETDVDVETDVDTADDVESGEGEDAEVGVAPADEEGADEPNNDEWAEFEKYKISDDEYDFSQADDDEIVKVYKLLKDDDQVLVNVDKDAKKVELKDNETGAEYLLDLSSFDNSNDLNFGGDADGELEMENNNMNESRIFELVLNEYDSHVGYTDNYQKKDVMTTPSTEEPGKNVNDWDAGVPKGKSKPWAGKGSSKPFEKKVNEEEVEDVQIEEQDSFVRRNSTTKTHDRNHNQPKARNASVAGVKVKGTADPRYSTNESKIMARVNQILKENEELKNALNKFKTVLQEAAVTNVNLGQIIKLISENSTTKDEKKEIIARFGNEAKTIEQSKSLYESISRELKKNNKMTIEEDKQFTTNSSKMINETQIYQSKDLLDSLDLMHRLCK